MKPDFSFLDAWWNPFSWFTKRKFPVLPFDPIEKHEGKFIIWMSFLFGNTVHCFPVFADSVKKNKYMHGIYGSADQRENVEMITFQKTFSPYSETWASTNFICFGLTEKGCLDEAHKSYNEKLQQIKECKELDTPDYIVTVVGEGDNKHLTIKRVEAEDEFNYCGCNLDTNNLAMYPISSSFLIQKDTDLEELQKLIEFVNKNFAKNWCDSSLTSDIQNDNHICLATCNTIVSEGLNDYQKEQIREMIKEEKEEKLEEKLEKKLKKEQPGDELHDD